MNFENKNKKLLGILIVFLALAMSGCTSRYDTYSNASDIKDNLKVNLVLDKTTYNKGEEVIFPITLQNIGFKRMIIRIVYVDINITTPRGSYLNKLELEQIHEYQSISIDPGKSLTEKVKWDQTYMAGGKKYEAIPGTYTLSTFLNLKTSSKKLETDIVESKFNLSPIDVVIR